MRFIWFVPSTTARQVNLIYAKYDNGVHFVTSHDSISHLKLLLAWTSGVANAPKIINTFLIRL